MKDYHQHLQNIHRLPTCIQQLHRRSQTYYTLHISLQLALTRALDQHEELFPSLAQSTYGSFQVQAKSFNITKSSLVPVPVSIETNPVINSSLKNNPITTLGSNPQQNKQFWDDDTLIKRAKDGAPNDSAPLLNCKSFWDPSPLFSNIG